MRRVFVRVHPYGSDPAHQSKLNPPRPHLPLRPLPGIFAKKRGIGMKLLQIAANRDALRQSRTIVEFQHRHLPKGILQHEFRALVGALTHRHMDERNGNAFLGEKYSDSARIWRWIMFVE